MQPICDVCVFGAGPAGATTAARLADLGFTVIVLNRFLAVKAWGGESFTGAIQLPLERLGLWEAFCAAGHVPGHERRVAWGHEPFEESSLFHEHGHSWHVNRSRFDADLREAMLQRDISLVNYSRLSGLRYEEKRWFVSVDQAPEITCQFVVDATGRARAIARRLGVRARIHDRLVALTAIVARNANPRFDHAMLIETTPQGWWYAAPVPQGHVLAFFTDADLAPTDRKRTFRTVAANSTFTPVDSMHGWLAVGDACAAHDPLCGWGVHRAMTNGLLASEAIGAYLRHDSTVDLAAYAEHCRRQFDGYLEGLTRHYSQERRWQGAPFWERRLSEPAPSS